MKLIIASAVFSTLLWFGAAFADTDTQDVFWFDETPTGDKSHLTRTDTMILVTVEAAGLPPGDAATLWWVVWNNPAGCTDGICGDDEFNDPTGAALAAAGAAVGNASGNVVKSDGTLEFGARLRPNMNEPGHQVLFGADSENHLLTVDPDDAEVHVVVQLHGLARGGGKLLEQLAFFEANCTPGCADVQFAVHLPAAP
jgi:hypothetical protein